MSQFLAHVSSKRLVTRVIISVALIGALCSANVATAAPLVTGQTIYPAPGEPDPVGGQVACGPLVAHFTTATFSGVLTSTVIAGDASNPYGGLTFTYTVSNDASSVNVEARLSVNGYSTSLTDASFQTPPSGVQPTYVDRPTADVVGFSFLGMPVGFGAIQPGQQSSLLVIQTNSPVCTNSFASVIDGAVATIPTYAPTPEPSALALLGLGAFALIRRRR